jgi:hypothetical protein
MISLLIEITDAFGLLTQRVNFFGIIAVDEG